MIRRSFPGRGVGACLGLAFALLTPAMFAADDEAPVAADDSPPHLRAPGIIDVQVHGADRVRAPGEEWFEAQAELQPERFSFSEEAVQALDEDGNPLDDWFEGWIDATGEYELIYDVEDEDVYYWQNIPADVLTRGRSNYVQFCASCHGFDGGGYGRSAQHLRPPPRSFHQSSFKFTHVTVGNLPSDEALVDLVLGGLDGTPMYQWALQRNQVQDIVQYLKTLSPPEQGWRDIYAEVHDVVDIGADPFAGDPAAGVDKGREVYHEIGCNSCHPGYVDGAAFLALTGKEPRTDFSYPKILPDSAYEVQGYAVSILPPDFTWHTVRRGRTADQIARTIASGIGGAGMPQWKGSIPDEDIWAMGHYVRSLIDTYHGQTAKRAAFMAELRK